MAMPGTAPVNHVLIYVGRNQNGEQMWVHCASGSGVVLNYLTYVPPLCRPMNVDFDAPVYTGVTGELLYELKVEVTLYCACSICYGNNVDGITSRGKIVARGLVAMSRYCLSGTQILIGGIMYTVGNRGDAYCGYERYAVAIGGRFHDGNRWRLTIPIRWAHDTVLAEPSQTTL